MAAADAQRGAVFPSASSPADRRWRSQSSINSTPSDPLLWESDAGPPSRGTMSGPAAEVEAWLTLRGHPAAAAEACRALRSVGVPEREWIGELMGLEQHGSLGAFLGGIEARRRRHEELRDAQRSPCFWSARGSTCPYGNLQSSPRPLGTSNLSRICPCHVQRPCPVLREGLDPDT